MQSIKKIIFILLVFNLTTFFAQNTIDSLSSTKIANVQTTQTLKKNHLECGAGLIFGKKLNKNSGTFNGGILNDVNINCQYGILNNLSAGIGLSNVNSLINGTIKWRFLNQTPSFKIPISIAFYGCMGYTHKTTTNLYANVIKDFPTKEAHRVNYLSQLIISSNINKLIYIQLLPSYIYRNFIKESVNVTNSSIDVNGFFSLGFAGKIKLTKQLNVIGNYFYNFANYYKDNLNVFNPLTFGLEINLKKNVFSVYLTNTNGIIENNFIPQTMGSWKNGQLKFGFNYARTFAL